MADRRRILGRPRPTRSRICQIRSNCSTYRRVGSFVANFPRFRHKKASKADDPVKSKIARRGLLSAILLFVPAITYPVAYIMRLYELPSYSSYYSCLIGGALAACIIDSAIIVVLRFRKNNKRAAKSKTLLYALTIVLFVVELIFCIGWGYGIVHHRIEADGAAERENDELAQTLRALRNPSIDDGLSDAAATYCNLEPYRIIYSDSRTEGIFGCDITDSRLDLFYAAYYGKNENGKIEVSVVGLGSISNSHKMMHASAIGETGRPYSIILVDTICTRGALSRTHGLARRIGGSSTGATIFGTYAKI